MMTLLYLLIATVVMYVVVVLALRHFFPVADKWDELEKDEEQILKINE